MFRPQLRRLANQIVPKNTIPKQPQTFNGKSYNLTVSPLINKVTTTSRRDFSVDHKAYNVNTVLEDDVKSYELAALLAISPIDGRYINSTKVLSNYFSEYALIRNRIIVEIRWLQHLADCPEINSFSPLTPAENEELESIISTFSPEEALKVKQIEKVTRHDIKAVEYYIKNRIPADSPLQSRLEYLHFACTSEDINNLSYALMIHDARENILLPKIDKVITTLVEQAKLYSDQPMLALTHGQPASPTTIGKEYANFASRLARQRSIIANTNIYGKMNGAVGNYNAHTIAFPTANWPLISKTFVQDRIGVDWNQYSSQIEFHDYIAELFDALARFNTILLDFNRDMWGYISLEYFKIAAVKNEIGSSTMPHKVNPIDFENSEGNIGLANATLSHLSSKLMVSRYQRDLSDSTALRNIGVGIAHSLIAYDSTLRGISKVAPNAKVLDNILNKSWQVLGEPIQTVLRVYNIPGAYEMLKELTRDTVIDQENVHKFIDALELPQEDKDRLKKLNPGSYIGLAKQQALDVEQFVIPFMQKKKKE